LVAENVKPPIALLEVTVAEFVVLVTAEKLKPPILEAVGVDFKTLSLPFVLKALVTESDALKLEPPNAVEFVRAVGCFTSKLLLLEAPNENPAVDAVPAELVFSVLALAGEGISVLPNVKPDAFCGASLDTALSLFAPNLIPPVEPVNLVSAPNVNPPVDLLDVFSDSVLSLEALLPNTNPEPLLSVLLDPSLPNLNPDVELLLDDPASNLKPPIDELFLDFDSSMALLLILKPDSAGLSSVLVNENPPLLDALILPLDDLVDAGMLNPLDWDIVNVFTQLGTAIMEISRFRHVFNFNQYAA